MITDQEIEDRMQRLSYPEELKPLVKDYIKENYDKLMQEVQK